MDPYAIAKAAFACPQLGLNQRPCRPQSHVFSWPVFKIVKTGVAELPAQETLSKRETVSCEPRGVIDTVQVTCCNLLEASGSWQH